MAYFKRPSLKVDYFYLFAVCDQCRESSKEWSSHFVIGELSKDVVCGQVVTYTTTTVKIEPVAALIE